MFTLDLQLFASKKGVGSTKNGRDSHSKRLGAKKGDGQTVKAGNIIVKEAPRSIQVKMLARAATIPCSQ